MKQLDFIPSWRTLPFDIRDHIVAFLIPSLADAARLARVDQECHYLVENAAKNFLCERRRRLGGTVNESRTIDIFGGAKGITRRSDDINSNDCESKLPAGSRSWVRVIASRTGQLPPNERLRLNEEVGESASLKGDNDEEGRVAIGGSDQAGFCDDFRNLDLREALVRGIEDYGILNPSRLQRWSLRPLLQMRNTLVNAPPGTGKTLSHAVAVLQNVDVKNRHCQALVLTPSRVRVHPLVWMHKTLGKHMDGIAAMACAGDNSTREYYKILRGGGIHIVVGTPLVIWNLVQRRALCLDHIRQLVIDDAYEVLSWGYKEPVYEIFFALPLTAVTAIFTTTLSDEVFCLASNVLTQGAANIQLVRPELTMELVHQYYAYVEQEEWKLDALCDILEIVNEPAFVYTNTQRKAGYLVGKMCERGINAAPILSSGGDEVKWQIQSSQERRICAFVVVDALAFAARKALSALNARHVLVINYDLPTHRESYLRRVGRNGRLAFRVTAVSIVSPLDTPILRDIELFYGCKIEELPVDFVTLL